MNPNRLVARLLVKETAWGNWKKKAWEPKVGDDVKLLIGPHAGSIGNVDFKNTKGLFRVNVGNLSYFFDKTQLEKVKEKK